MKGDWRDGTAGRVELKVKLEILEHASRKRDPHQCDSAWNPLRATAANVCRGERACEPSPIQINGNKCNAVEGF
eukprot:6214791-Pleurochrysis_carterae.AAC.13